MKLTIWELHQLERAPKSRRRRVLERGLSALPLLLAVSLILEYKLAPNFAKYAANKIAYPVGDTYTVLVGAFAAVLLVRLIFSFFSEKAYEQLIHKAPLYCTVIGILMVYDIATLKTGGLPLPYFPWVDRVLGAIVDDRKLLLDCIAHSLVLLFAGYLSGVAAGLFCGVGAGWGPRIRYWVMPVIKLLGPIPSTTWISIILIAASSLFAGSVFMIALGVWYPVTMAAYNGVSNVDKSNFEVARTFGVGKAGLVFKVAIPAAMPSIFNGLTQGMGIACTALMVAEMLGVESGLGWYINWQRGWAEFAKMYAAVVIICLTFTAVNLLLTLVKKRVLRWREGNI
ncbi:MAG: ABC transporter permease subunit [Clostridiales Family XIII bacterium]|jgi:NitT/TauT family transport system permease protein|nr:ABC transporter permease subunit [Clostridiales Family XIII bacterium]